jgi:hypothetical protein
MKFASLLIAVVSLELVAGEGQSMPKAEKMSMPKAEKMSMPKM